MACSTALTCPALCCVMLYCAAGDKIVADGVVVESHGLVVDEASLTGESDPIKKTEEDPWCRSGTQVRHTRPTAAAAGCSCTSFVSLNALTAH
jgi:magnesium-transporting ATPase (P-type)